MPSATASASASSMPQKTVKLEIKSTPKPAASIRDKLLRLKRQLALENELSSAADESENLGIEQVKFHPYEAQSSITSNGKN